MNADQPVKPPVKILCLLPSMVDTRIARRIDMLQRGGFAVEAAAFERHQRTGRRPQCPVDRLGRIPPRRYWSRIPRLLRAAPKVRAAIRRNDVVFAFSPDLACLSLIAGAGLKRPLALEVADIYDLQVSEGWGGAAVRALERYAVRRCGLLSLTSEGYRAYYRDWLGADAPIIIMENKLDPEFVQSLNGSVRPAPEGEPLAERPLRIGWFGRLRDEWTLQVLDRLTRAAPGRFAAVLSGAPSPYIKDFSQRIADNPGLEYRGAFRDYPDDLPELYGGVDMVMGCYPPEIPSGWAQHNRYYEACLFRRPLIARAGCYDADEVRRRGVGLVIDADCPAAAAAAIASVSPGDIARWRGNAEALPAQVYASIEEPDVLVNALSEIAG